MRADVIQVAPDVSGLVTQVDVVDNQMVKRGQLLFVIDQARYTLALRLSQATLEQRRATLAQAKREYARNIALGMTSAGFASCTKSVNDIDQP